MWLDACKSILDAPKPFSSFLGACIHTSFRSKGGPKVNRRRHCKVSLDNTFSSHEMQPTGQGHRWYAGLPTLANTPMNYRSYWGATTKAALTPLHPQRWRGAKIPPKTPTGRPLDEDRLFKDRRARNEGASRSCSLHSRRGFPSLFQAPQPTNTD